MWVRWADTKEARRAFALTNMSVAYQRWKMRMTTATVDQMRYLCDGCCVVINFFAKPMRRLGARVVAESPWVVIIASSSFISIVPLALYPFYKNLLFRESREEREKERVRLCVQKGIDPYPFLPYRGYAPALVASEKQELPPGWSTDKWSVEEQIRRKEELRQQVGGKPEDSVERLMELWHAQEVATRRAELSSRIQS